MCAGLKNNLGLGEPKPKGTTEQSDNFKTVFQAQLGPINADLQYTSSHAPRAKHDAHVSKRDTVYKAYQAAVAKIDPANPSAAQGSINTVMSAVKGVGVEIATFRKTSEEACNAWNARENEVDQLHDKIREMNEWGHPKAGALQGITDAIQTKANDRFYREAIKALDQTQSKVKPVLEDYDKQRTAEKEYAPGYEKLKPRLEAAQACVLKAVAEPLKKATTAAGKMTADAEAKNYVAALTQLKPVEALVVEVETRKTEAENQKKAYEDAVAPLREKLSDCAQSKYQRTAALQQEISTLQAEMETAAAVEDYVLALQKASPLEVKVEAYHKEVAELDRLKGEYEKKLGLIDQRMSDGTQSMHPKLADTEEGLISTRSRMEEAAKQDNYELAGQVANELADKLDEYETRKNELEKKKKEYDDALADLQPRLSKVNQTDNNPNIGPLQKEIADAQERAAAEAKKEDFDQALTLIKILSTMLDSYEKTEAGQVYLVIYEKVPYYLPPEELAALRIKVTAKIVADGITPLKHRAEMNERYCKDLETLCDEHSFIGGFLNLLSGTSVESMKGPVAEQQPAIDAVLNALTADPAIAGDTYEKALKAVNAASQAITAYLDAIETSGDHTITVLEAMEVVAFTLAAALGAACIVTFAAGAAGASATTAGFSTTVGANAAAGAIGGAGQSLSESLAPDILHILGSDFKTYEKPLSASDIATRAAVAAVTNGVGAAIGTYAGQQVGGQVLKRLVVKFGFQQEATQLLLKECVEGMIGNTVQTAVAALPDLISKKISLSDYATAIAEAMIIGGIVGILAGKATRKYPVRRGMKPNEIAVINEINSVK